MNFTKMHGTGNDFIVIEDLKDEIKNKQDMARTICSRRFGIGADGILFVQKGQDSFKMLVVNSDGSVPNMCGNGIRCFAKYLYETGLDKNTVMDIETGDGMKKAELAINNGHVEKVTIDMGKSDFNPKSIPANGLDKIIDREIQVNDKKYKINSLLLGVPHTIIFGKLDEYDVREGKEIEHFNLFPEGTNVNFCEVSDRKNIKVKTWERGAGATLACGTGTCASFASAYDHGMVDDRVDAVVPGGKLQISIKHGRIYMTGNAVEVFKGNFH